MERGCRIFHRHCKRANSWQFMSTRTPRADGADGEGAPQHPLRQAGAQAAAANAATEKDEARKEAKRIKRVARKERKKVELAAQAELAAEQAAGHAALVAIAEFEVVAKAAAEIKEALEEMTLTIVSHKMRMQKVFRFGPHTLALTVPQGSVFASMDEDEMLKVMKKDTNDVVLVGSVSYLLKTFLRRWERIHHPMLRCRSIRQKADLKVRQTDRLMRPPHRALVNLGQIQSVQIPAPIGANKPVDVQGGITPTQFWEAQGVPGTL